MLGIVVAMEKEASYMLSNSTNIIEIEYANKKIYTGKFKNREFSLIISGLGKVNAGMSTQILIDKYNINKVINFGVAGGKNRNTQNIGDVILIDRAVQYDFDLSELDNVNIGYIQNYDLTYFPTSFKDYKGSSFKSGTLASADRFTNKQYFLDIIHNLKCEVVDMEGAAIAQVCYSNNIDLYILKALSDIEGLDDDLRDQYYNNLSNLGTVFPEAIEDLLNNLE